MRDEVTVEDKKLKEKTAHQSQVDFNKGFGGKFGVERSGTYTCIASNRHGESKIDVLINVLCEYKNDNHFA